MLAVYAEPAAAGTVGRYCEPDAIETPAFWRAYNVEINSSGDI